jgi:hypothetical protein
MSQSKHRRFPTDIALLIAGYSAHWSIAPWATHLVSFTSSDDLQMHPQAIDYIIHTIEHGRAVNWIDMSQNPAAIHLLLKNLDKIEWESFSMNPAAWPWLCEHPEKIDTNIIWSNPAALDWLLEQKWPIDWDWLSINCSLRAISLLEQNFDKVNWNYAHGNSGAMKLLRMHWKHNGGRINWIQLSFNTHPDAIKMLHEHEDSRELHRVEWAYNPCVFEAAIPSGLIEVLFSI